MRAAGISIKAGRVYISAVAPGADDEIVLLSSSRLVPNSHLGEAEVLADLQSRLTSEFQALQVERIAALHVRVYGGWKYADALARITSLCAVMGASTALQIPFETIKTGEVAKTVSLKPSELNRFESATVGCAEDPMYWTAGVAESAALATHVVRAG